MKVVENLTRKQRDDLRKELDEVLKKREFYETKAKTWFVDWRSSYCKAKIKLRK